MTNQWEAEAEIEFPQAYKNQHENDSTILDLKNEQNMLNSMFCSLNNAAWN